MIWLTPVAVAGPLVLRVPFPTQRLYDRPDRVCVSVPMQAPPSPPVESDDGRFHAACEQQDGRVSVCLTLSTEDWPERMAPLECQQGDRVVRILPVPAFDPAEDVWDGVVVVRKVSRVQAAFRVDSAALAAGAEGRDQIPQILFQARSRAIAACRDAWRT